jgi:arylsulfatase A-like enzyme
VHAQWHLGFSTADRLPYRRGFNRSVGFLGGGENHYLQTQGECSGVPSVDLWATDRPAYGQNGTYSAFLYTEAAEGFIADAKAAGMPLFMYFAAHEVHAPWQAPQRFIELYNDQPWWGEGDLVRTIPAMVSAMDESVGNVSKALKAHGMWESTLLLFSADK